MGIGEQGLKEIFKITLSKGSIVIARNLSVIDDPTLSRPISCSRSPFNESGLQSHWEKMGVSYEYTDFVEKIPKAP
jgi:hypothetical protein